MCMALVLTFYFLYDILAYAYTVIYILLLSGTYIASDVRNFHILRNGEVITAYVLI